MGRRCSRFECPRALVSLREAVRAAYERGDGGPLLEQWGRHIEPYRAARAHTRWRVASETIAELVEELRATCDRVEREPPTDGVHRATPAMVSGGGGLGGRRHSARLST